MPGTYNAVEQSSLNEKLKARNAELEKVLCEYEEDAKAHQNTGDALAQRRDRPKWDVSKLSHHDIFFERDTPRHAITRLVPAASYFGVNRLPVPLFKRR